MIENVTINSIAAAVSNVAGKITYPSPVTVGVRGNVQDARSASNRELGATLKDASAVIFVPKSLLATKPDQQSLINVTIDGSDPKDYFVVYVDDQEKAMGLAHFEIFVKEIK
jgi:hypothetical protein